MRRRFLKWFLVVALAVGVILALAYLFVRSSYCQHMIKGQVVAYVEERLYARLTIERVTGNPLYGLSLQGVRLTDLRGREVLRAGRIRVVYFLPALLEATDDFALRLKVEGFTLRAVRGADGRLDLAQLLRPRPPSGPVRVHIKAVTLQGGRLLLTLEGGTRREHAREFALEKLEAAGRADITTGARAEVSVAVDRASFALTQPGNLTVRRLSGGVHLAPSGLAARFEALTMSSHLRLAYSAGGTVIDASAAAAPLDLAEVQPLLSQFLPLFPSSLPATGRLTGSVSLQGPRHLSRLKADLALGHTSIKAVGNLDLADLARPGYGLSATFQGLDPATLSTSAAGAGLTGSLGGALKLVGRGLSLGGSEARLRLELGPSKLGRYGLRRASLAARLTPGRQGQGRLELAEPAEIEFPFGRLSLTGEVSDVAALGAGRLAAHGRGEVRSLDLAALTGRRGMASDINASFEAALNRIAAGRPLRATGSVELAASTIGGRRIEAGSLRAALVGSSVDVSRLRLLTPLGELNAQGSLAGGHLEGRFQAAARDLGPLAAALGAPVPAGGRLSVQGRVTGSPAAPALSAEVEGTGVRYGPYRAGSLKGSLSAGDVRHFGAPATLSVRAEELTALGRELAQASAEGRWGAGQLIFSADGADCEGHSVRLAGTAGNISRAGASLTLGEVSLKAPGFELRNDRALAASVSPQGLRVPAFSLASPDRATTLFGSLDTGGPVDLSLTFSNVRLSSWLPESVPLQGRAGGRVHLTGTASQPRVAAQVSVTGASVRDLAGRERALQHVAVGLLYSAGRLKVEALLVHQGNEIRASGSLPLLVSLSPARVELGRSGLDLTLKAERLDLGLLAAALGVKKAEVAGSISAAVRATGDPRQPEVAGRATLSGGALFVAGYPQRLRNVRGEVSFSRNLLVVEHLSAESEDGRVDLSGSLGLRQPMSLNLELAARGFRVRMPNASWARVNADLDITGSRVEPTVEGQIEVIEARLKVPEHLVPSLREIRVVENMAELDRSRREPEGVLPRLERQVAVDVALEARNRVRIIGRGLDAEFSLSLEAVKERQGRLRLLGTADVVRGSYSIRNKRLTIDRAQALFQGLPELNPELSARLTYDAQQQTTVVILVSGTVAKPEIQITSEPPMEQTNVFSYFFFGRPANTLAGGENQVLQQQVAALVGGAAVQEVTGVLGKQFALDTLQVTPAEGSLGVETVSLGKYLTRDLYLTFERTFGIEAQSQVRVDYRLSKRFSLESQFGSERTAGFDVFWNYDFSYLFK